MVGFPRSEIVNISLGGQSMTAYVPDTLSQRQQARPNGASPARLGLAYKVHVTMVLLSLALFFAFYMSVLAAAAFALFALLRAIHLFEGGLFFWLLFGAGTATTLVVFVFLLKGLFKRQSVDRERFVEVTAESEPVLFGFLEELCRDTGAKMPGRVYLCADVNAGVFYDSSVMSLFLPVRKNLLIGLGLVNTLNSSELKAVLAHEFGHFAQRTMRISSYVYVVDSVFQHMIFGPDLLDELLARGRRKWFGLFGLAWVLTGLIWSLRRFFGLGLKLIHVFDAALSRQMELHADRVAVSLTGSDALVHALLKSEYGEQCLAQTHYDLRQAAHRDLYSSDLFFHHSRMMEYMRLVKDDPELGCPPALSPDPSVATMVFAEEASTPTSMWASHPSFYARERNAKRHYQRSPIDERSPWLLFADPQAARRAVTTAHLRAEYGDGFVLSAPSKVQRFLDEEHAEVILDRRYRGMYDNRFLEPGDLDELIAEAGTHEPAADETLRAEVDRLYGDELRAFMEQFHARLEEIRMLQTVMGGHLQWGKTFAFRGEQYQQSSAGELFGRLNDEMSRDRQWFAELDRRIFLVHLQIAARTSPELHQELSTRYQVHMLIQAMTRELRAAQNPLGAVLALLNGGPLDDEAIDQVFETLLEVHGVVTRAMETGQNLVLPGLNNIDDGTTLSQAILAEPLISDETLRANELDHHWLESFLGQYERILDQLTHLRRKSLGGLLFVQEDIVRQWQA
jgi:Zn-dependent protease with chaperone function